MVLILFVVLPYLILKIVFTITVIKDTKKYGMNSIGWGVFAVLLSVICLPVYLIVRKKKKKIVLGVKLDEFGKAEELGNS